MTRIPIVIESLDIRRMPGFLNGGFAFEELSPQVNVLYGPNGAGKTTTAKVVEEIFWPSKDDFPAFRSSLKQGGDNWKIDQDGRIRDVQRNNMPAVLPEIPSSDTRDRYKLAFQDLLIDRNSSLAHHITRESMGGYDVNSAVASCGYRPVISSQGKAAKAYTDANTAHRKALDMQNALAGRQDQLGVLSAQLLIADTQVAESDLLQKALDYRHLCDEERAPLLRFRSFPRSLTQVKPDDLTNYNGYASEIAEGTSDLRSSWRNYRDARYAKAITGMSRLKLSTIDMKCLENLAREIDQCERALHEYAKATSGCIAREDDARRKLSSDMVASTLDKLDKTGLSRFAKAARTADQVNGAETARNALRAIFQVGPQPVQVRNLIEAERAMLEWLASSEPASIDNGRTQIAVAVIFAAGVIADLVLSFTGRVFWLVLLVPMIAGLAVAWQKKMPVNSDKERAKTAYGRCGLHEPNWSQDGINRCLEETRAKIAEADVNRVKADRLQALLTQYAGLDRQTAALDAELNALRVEYGPGFFIDDARNGQFLPVAEKTALWRQANNELASARAQEVASRAAFGAKVKSFNEMAARFSCGAANDAFMASAIVTALADRSKKYELALRDINAASGQVGSLIKQIKSKRARLMSLCRRLNVDFEDRDSVARMVAEHIAYVAQKELVKQKQTQRKMAKAALKGHPTYLRVPYDELVSRRAAALDAAARRDAVKSQIQDLKGDISRAKSGHDIEQALDMLANAEQNLAEARSAEYANQAGLLLSEFLKNETRLSARPVVFNRARDLFARITKGRYNLEISETGAFRAIDSIAGTGHGLDELSSGTRVQLLIATRVAFITELESEFALPLVFDEALANSDEERSAAIIETVLQLCAEGRQVFYLTARYDEVEKWQSAAALREDVQVKVVDLTRVRNQSEANRVPRSKYAPAPIPQPDGMDREAYAEALGVAGVNPRQDAAAVDTCYLTDDTQIVYQLRHEHGVSSWGQLRSLWDTGLRPVNLSQYANMSARAEALESLLTLWKVGRPNPLTMLDIQKSGAVTDIFISRFSRLINSTNGDGSALIGRLRAGDVPGFRTNKIDALEVYLTAKELISDGGRIERDAAVQRVYQIYAADEGSEHLSFSDVDNLSGLLPF